MRRLRWGVRLALCVVGVWVLFATLPVHAAIAPYISFQGKLTNTDGTNVPDGNYSIRFRLYTSTAPTDATNACSANSCQWEETQSTVAVSGGLFQVNLGSVTALPGSVNFNSTPLYLGVKVGSDAEMTPRIQLTASPYSFNSDLLDGIDSSGLVQLSPGSQQTGNINVSGTINSNNFNSSTLLFGAASTAAVQSAASQALTITANAASTWSTSAGTLTIQAGSGTVSLGSSTVLSSAGALNLNSGSATALTVDSGTTGALNLGTGSNAKTISIGNTTGATAIASFVGSGTNAFSIQGVSSAIYIQLDTTNDRLYVGNPTADATALQLVLDSRNVAAETSAPAVTGVNGSMYYNSANNKFRCFENAVWKNCSNGTADTFSTVQSAAATAATKAAAGTILISPLYVSGQITVNEIRVSVITTALGAAGDVGIYNASGALVLNGGSSSLTTAIGLKTIAPVQTGAARILEPGQYYAAVTWNATTGSVSAAALPVAGLIKRVGTITGGGLVLPSSLTLSSITAAANIPALTINN